MGVESVSGIARERVDPWLAERVAGTQPPFEYRLIAGGRSNLTYGVTDSAGLHWALRRPPMGKTLGSAHDMGRECRVVSALEPTPVPVAHIAGFCDDDSVNGAPFYVMDFVDGPILRGRDDADPYDEGVHKTLVGMLTRAGRHGEARRAFRRPRHRHRADRRLVHRLRVEALEPHLLRVRQLQRRQPQRRALQGRLADPVLAADLPEPRHLQQPLHRLGQLPVPVDELRSHRLRDRAIAAASFKQ